MKFRFAVTLLATIMSHTEVSGDKDQKGASRHQPKKNNPSASTSAQTYIIDFEDSSATEGQAAVAHLAASNALTVTNNFERFGIMVVTTTSAVADSLSKNSAIKAVELDQDMSVDGWQDKEMKSKRLRGNERQLAETAPYGIGMVNADWDGFPSPPQAVMKVCVVDTGYNNLHEDLPDLDNDSDGANGYSQEWHEDGHGHGSHCAGTIGAIGNNGIGVTSVLNDYNTTFNFFIGKGLSNSGSGSTSGVIAAMNACVDAGANVVSMSLGGGGYSQAFVDAAKTALTRGTLLVAAAGNSYDSGVHYPASYDQFMSVAAVDSNKNKAGFSTYNEQTEIAAPGVNVLSTITGVDGYASWSGTSMACPHVAGVAALVWGHFPECTPYQIRQALIQSAERRGEGNCNWQYGFGIVNASAAYELLDGVGCNGVSPHSVADDELKGGCEFNSTVAAIPPTPAPTPCTGGTTFRLDLLTDRYAYETSWELKDSSNSVISQGSGYENSREYSETRCLGGGSYTFFIYDSYGDGICCGYGLGWYKLFLDEAVIKEGGDFDSVESVSFTTSGSAVPTSTPTASPTSSPTSAPTPCTGKIITVEIKTDRFAYETSYEIKDAQNNVVLEGSDYQSETTYSESTCLQDGDYEFIIYDSHGDGLCCNWGDGYYKVYLNEDMVKHGAEFGFNETFPFDTSITAAPTSTPTFAPTATPTSSPTVAPTATPTSAPTSAPTAPPTPAPAAPPTPAPTAAPTACDVCGNGDECCRPRVCEATGKKSNRKCIGG